ncbi:MAG: hypothetical protein U0103_24525 [Candidatus Obscuribacterales bacterium]
MLSHQFFHSSSAADKALAAQLLVYSGCSVRLVGLFKDFYHTLRLLPVSLAPA